MVPSRFTLEDQARLSNDEAVRRRFDLGNLRVLRWLSWPLVIAHFVFFVVMSDLEHPLRAAVAGVGILLSLIGAVVFRRALLGGPTDRLGSLVAVVHTRARPWTIGFLIAELLLVWLIATGNADGVFAFAIIASFCLITVRLYPSETILLYAMVIGTLIAEMILVDSRKGQFVPGTIFAGIALAINLGATRRSRRLFLEEWRETRRSAKEQLRMREELDFARDVQLSMLPREPPRHEWLEIASLSLPATEVGGDYYDFFDLGEGRLAVVIGDVAGHGLASGMVLSGIRSCLTLLREDLMRPAEVMERLDRMLRETTAHRMFVTLSILILDRFAGKALLSSAGHPPLFILREGQVERIETAALPLGTPMVTRIDQREIEIRPGDLLVLQTDGVYETVSAYGESYGFDRFAEAMASSPPRSSIGQHRDALLRDLWMFRGDALQRDDVTLVLIRIR